MGGPSSTRADSPLLAMTLKDKTTLTWGSSVEDRLRTVEIWRSDNDHAAAMIGQIAVNFAGGQIDFTFDDPVNDLNGGYHSGSSCPAAKTCYNTAYSYYVISIDADNNRSAASNLVGSEVKHLFVIADNQPDTMYGNAYPTGSSLTFKTYGKVQGTLNASLVSCGYGTAIPGDLVPRNVGTYNVLCAGPDQTSSANGVTYNIAYTEAGILHDAPGKLKITTRPITVTAASDTKVYDGTTASSMTAVLTPGSPVYGDTANFTQVFDSRNAGARTLTPSGTVNDGNGGYNYSYNFVTAPGTISPRPISVTALPDTKTYDGTTASSKTPTITLGSLATGDTTTNFTQVFDSRNAGARTLTPSGTVNDGNGGNNYSYTFVTAAGTINQRPITVTALSDTKTYDGTRASGKTPTITLGSLATGDTTTNFTQVFNSRNAGARTLIPSGIVNDGNGGNNYSYTFVTTPGTINPRPISVTAAANTKNYDGTTSASATPTITSGSLVTGDTSNFIETYDNPNPGTNKKLTPSGSVTDGNGGQNYAVTFVSSNNGVILPYYVFSGFFSPLTTAGTPAAPTDSGTANFQRVVPTKWRLTDSNGNPVVSLTTLTSFMVIRNDSCVVGPASGAAIQLYSPTTGAAGGTSFRSDSSGGFIFNWDPTQTSTPGCFNIVVGLDDGSFHATFLRLN